MALGRSTWAYDTGKEVATPRDREALHWTEVACALGLRKKVAGIQVTARKRPDVLDVESCPYLAARSIFVRCPLNCRPVGADYLWWAALLQAIEAAQRARGLEQEIRKMIKEKEKEMRKQCTIM